MAAKRGGGGGHQEKYSHPSACSFGSQVCGVKRTVPLVSQFVPTDCWSVPAAALGSPSCSRLKIALPDSTHILFFLPAIIHIFLFSFFLKSLNEPAWAHYSHVALTLSLVCRRAHVPHKKVCRSVCKCKCAIIHMPRANVGKWAKMYRTLPQSQQQQHEDQVVREKASFKSGKPICKMILKWSQIRRSG